MSGECNVCGLTGCVEDNHPAPEPPEVEAAELAAAEAWARTFVSADGWYRQNTHIALLLREYDRRGEEAAYWQRECGAWLRIAIAEDGKRFDQLEQDLARALPVVEAAGAVVSLIDVEMFHHDQSDCRCPARFDQGKHEEYCAANPCGSECFRCVLDALASAVNGGEQG